MAQNIRMTEEIKQKLLQEFAAQLEKFKGIGSKINVSQEIKKVEADRMSIIVSPRALCKMLELVFCYDSEIAWHGTVSRPETNKFVIEDIYVYPQQVAAATVNTDEEEYSKWIINLPDEVLNNLRFQGHSHVRMGVTPSSVDLDHQQKIVNQLGSDDFYIFAILNQNMSFNFWIYDMVTNIKYETDDIDLYFISEQIDAEVNQMMDYCQTVVTKKSYTTAKPVADKPTAPKLKPVENITVKKGKKKKGLQDKVEEVIKFSQVSKKDDSWGKYADRYFYGYPYEDDDEDWWRR